MTELAGRAAMRPVHIDNIRLEPIPKGDDAFDINVVFDVGWEDSWRAVDDIAEGRNWDAAWIFLKLKMDLRFTLSHSNAQALWDAVLSERFADVLAVLRHVLPTAAKHLSEIAADNDYEVVRDHRNPWRLKLSLRPKKVAESSNNNDEQTYLVLTAEQPLDEGEGDKCFTMADDAGHWGHGYVSPDPSHHHAPEGATIAPAEDGTGVFLYRSKDNCGRGPVHFRGVKLRWPLDAPIDDDVARSLKMWIHALQMVHVNEGPFWLGDPAGREGPTGCFFDAAENGPFRVDSEQPIEVAAQGTDSGLGWQDRENTPMATIPAAFPKGHRGFYCMLGHVSQGEYCDFINSLRGEAITLHYPYLAEGNFRFTLYKGGTRTRVASRPLRPCNFLSWTDAVAYLWWAGLRPMTEMEFEKACRGPLPPVEQEYAWGSTMLERTQVIVGDEASGNESVDGNCHCDNAEIILRGGDGENGPVRCGAFASPGKPNTDWMHPTSRVTFLQGQVVPEVTDVREMTGASYYGIHCLSGNLWEFVVNVSYEVGRAFLGDHGTGMLNAAGAPAPKLSFFSGKVEPMSNTWPGTDGRGMGFRGGAFYTRTSRVRVADRYYAMGLEGYVMRSQDTGCRGVRTAPARSTED